MKRKSPTVIRFFVAVPISLLLLGLLFARFMSPLPGRADSAVDSSTFHNRHRAETINLALRRTAHHLLWSVGDSTSRIPAVQQPDPQTFRVTLGRAFNYDLLPDLLQRSLDIYQIKGVYNVSVLDCARGELQLGYTVSDLIGDKPVPCGGRSMAAGCYILQVTFEAPSPPSQPATHWPLLAMSGVLISLLLVIRNRSARTRAPSAQPASGSANRLRFGVSCLDVGSQTLASGNRQHNLTYREAKLLHLLVNHANQVLERDLILKLIWEDEGVTVSRSLDVFVSRLRKLLHDDPSVRIAAVHGIGYRLEVQEQK